LRVSNLKCRLDGIRLEQDQAWNVGINEEKC
jgi:ABC-type enterochelin transport system permease subunit